MRHIIAVCVAVIVMASPLAVLNAENPCAVVAYHECFDLPGNTNTFCIGTECVNNLCPNGTTESGPTAERYNETLSEAEAMMEGLFYDGPYETFQFLGNVSCRASLDCTECDPFGTTMQCSSPIHFGEDFTNAAYSFSEANPTFSGVQWCE